MALELNNITMILTGTIDTAFATGILTRIFI